MPSTIRDLTELTAVAADDYFLVSDTSDVTNRDKRISRTNLIGSLFLPLTQIKAASGAGLTIEDDGGNVGVLIADGGVTTIANSLFVSPVAGAVRARNMGGLYEFAVLPGVTVTTAQTWTIDITLPNAGSNFSAILDIGIDATSGANPPTAVRALYRATVSFYRAASGAIGVVIPAAVVHINSNLGVTITGPTGIADGIRFVVAPTAASINRNGATLIITSPTLAPVVTSTVA